MNIKQLIVYGYCSIDHAVVNFTSGLNVLVGKNNAGKSNLIEAIEIVLGEKSPTYRDYDENCFFRDGSDAEPVEAFMVALQLEGDFVDDAQVARIERNIRCREMNGTPTWENMADWIETQTYEMFWRSYVDLLKGIRKAERVYLFVYVPRLEGQEKRQQGICFKIGSRWFCATYLNNEFRAALLTAAYIPSFRDANYQLRINGYSWYGKVIKHFYEQRSNEQRTKIDEARSQLITVLDEIFGDATEHVSKQLSRAIFHNTLSFRPGAYTEDDDYKQITLFIDDGLDAPFYEKGTGIQSALIIALFALYCTKLHSGSSLLLVEEPEIYLHPQARRAVEAQLVEFVDAGKSMPDDQSLGDESKHQVIISTHSPEFLRSITPDQLTLVRKLPGQTATVVKGFSSSRSQSDSLRDTRTSQVIETKNAEMFFADHVLLVEGGEEYIIPALADLFFEEYRWLDYRNVTVARVNGKTQFKTYTALLDQYGIDWTLLADLDFLKEGIEDFTDCLDKDGQTALQHVKQTWSALSSLPTGRKIKEKVFDPSVIGWQKLYEEVDEAIEGLCNGTPLTSEQIETIQGLWTSLEERVQKANHAKLIEECEQEICTVADQLAKHGVFVLQRGDLEDYFTDGSMNLSTSKDRRALDVSKSLRECKEISDIESWITPSDEFNCLLQHVAKRLKAHVPDSSMIDEFEAFTEQFSNEEPSDHREDTPF